MTWKDKEKEYMRIYAQENKERIKEHKKKYRDNNRDKLKKDGELYRKIHDVEIKVRSKKSRKKRRDKIRKCQKEYRVRKEYGISIEEYNEFLVRSSFCPICFVRYRTGNKGTYPVLDHCHITGKIRGCVCCTCNRIMGIFKDDPERLQRAINWLRNIK
jgi:hypothetical protein